MVKGFAVAAFLGLCIGGGLILYVELHKPRFKVNPVVTLSGRPMRIVSSSAVAKPKAAPSPPSGMHLAAKQSFNR
jgi:hypothetical protein